MIPSSIGPLAIKVTLLLALALLVDLLMRRRWVLGLAAFWNAILVALVVLPPAMLLVPRLTLTLLPADVQPALAETKRAAPPQPNPSASFDSQGILSTALRAHGQKQANATTVFASGDMLPLVLAGIYVAGALAVIVRLVASWHAVNDLRRRATPVTDSELLQRFDDCTARVRLREHKGASRSGSSTRIGGRPSSIWRSVTLLQSDRINVPIALGVWNPAILIPTHLIAGTNVRTMDAILIHELAHIERGDYGWQLLHRVVEAWLWFHPLIWMSRTRIAFIRERACDDFAVRLVGDFHFYGETLLTIAAGMTRRRALGLGLALVRSSSLARRLAAIKESEGSSRCAAGPRTRYLLTAGMVCAAVALGCVAIGRASAAFDANDSPSSSKGPAADENPSASPSTKSPELIALTWQQIPEANSKRIPQPVWRPDGTRLTEAEAKGLGDKVKGFQQHWWNKSETLRPLVFVFRTSPRIQTGLQTAIVRPDGRRLWSGSCGTIPPSGLAKSACSPARTELEAWPARVDVNVKVPLESPKVIKAIRSVPDKPVDVAAGVRWYIDKTRGVDHSNRDSPRYGLTAAVLEFRDGSDSMDSSTSYDAKIWLRGKKQPLPVAYATVIEPQTGVRATIYVSAPIDDVRSVERVEFTRQRFGFERLNGLVTHLDLLPPDS